MAMELFYQVRRMTHLDPVKIDGWVFRLHYWVTSTGIFAASAVAFAKQYFGDPIECIFDAKTGGEIKAVDAYCWLHATVHLDSDLIRKLSTIPGIRTPCKGFPNIASQSHDLDPMETLYYQWVPFFLLFQGVMFRLPWKLWRHLEGGKMEEFGMEAKRHLVSSEAEEAIAHQYASAFNSILHRNNSYFAQYMLCEILNLTTLVIVVALTDQFLGKQFWGYGSRVWEYHQMLPTERSLTANPMCSLFPTVTSCQFPSGAVTGSINVDHAMCILSLNIINDKIFLLEWCWFFLLAIITLISLVGTLIFVLFPSFRKYWIRRKARMWGETDKEVINSVLSRCYVGDFFLLHLLSKNTNPYIFKRIMKSVAIVFREHKSNKNTNHSSSSVGGAGPPSGSRTGSIGARYSIERLEFTKNGV